MVKNVIITVLILSIIGSFVFVCLDNTKKVEEIQDMDIVSDAIRKDFTITIWTLEDTQVYCPADSQTQWVSSDDTPTGLSATFYPKGSDIIAIVVHVPLEAIAIQQ